MKLFRHHIGAYAIDVSKHIDGVDLAASISDINTRSRQYGGVAIDTLVAGIEEGKRSFKIYRTKPDGKSYARDIADKYGLSFENLMSRAEGRIKK